MEQKVVVVKDLTEEEYVAVYDEGWLRWMVIMSSDQNYGIKQGAISRENPDLVLEAYSNQMIKALLEIVSTPKSATILGMGVGGQIRLLRQKFSEEELTIHVIEKYMMMMVVSEQYFLGTELASTCQYQVKDYRDYLREHFSAHQLGAADAWFQDILIVDVTSTRYHTKEFLGKQFYEQCYDRLQAGGALAVNLVGGQGDINTAIMSANTVFGNYKLLDVHETSNVILICQR